jgi:hypothetical protein
LHIANSLKMSLGEPFEWVGDQGVIPRESFDWIDKHTVRVYYPEEPAAEWFKHWKDDECSRVKTLITTFDGFCNNGLPFTLLRFTNLQRLFVSSTRLWRLRPERLPPSIMVLYFEDVMNTDTRLLKASDKYCPNMDSLVIDSDSVINRRRTHLPPLPLLQTVVLTDYSKGQNAGFFRHYEIEEFELMQRCNSALDMKYSVQLKKSCNHGLCRTMRMPRISGTKVEIVRLIWVLGF